jgi:glycosyltransferase involved in cell wall biosynthesis
MKSQEELRIAWVMPITCVYWQAILKDFVKLFPQTKVFTTKIFPSPWGWEKNLNLEVVGKFKVIQFKTQSISYGSKLALMSPAIIGKLFNYQPQIIFADTFCFWTLLVLFTKFWGKWQVILACEGSSPGVDYCHSPSRLLLRRLIVKMTDACITNTRGGKNYLTKKLYAGENKVFIYPYLVPDVECLTRKVALKNSDMVKLKRELKQPIFLFIGRLIPRKGIQLLLEACLSLRKQGITNYSLLVIGEGEQQVELEKFCQDNHLENNIKWIGTIEYQAISAYFQLADILVLPCLEDTWGMVVLEAILFSKLILCSNGAGASEIVAEHQNGYVFEAQNTEQLAQLMTHLINNPNSVKLMQQKSQKIASKYTPELAVKFLSQVVNFVR